MGAGGRPHGGPRQAVGAAAEALVAEWYEDHGYEVLERNWRRREGEVDLVVRQGRTVVFCEVKARSSDRFGTGAEAVVPAKQQRIRRLASRWLSELTPAAGRRGIQLRFDVAVVGLGDPGTAGFVGPVEVIEAAF